MSSHQPLFWKSAGISFAAVFLPSLLITLLFRGSSEPVESDQGSNLGNSQEESEIADGGRVATEPTASTGTSSEAEQPAETDAKVSGKQNQRQESSSTALKGSSKKPGIYEFQLPGPTWSAAYDEESARLAFTNDDHGVLVYDLDMLAWGKSEPIGKIPTSGLPLAVCFKRTDEHSVFVVSGDRLPRLDVYEVSDGF